MAFYIKEYQALFQPLSDTVIKCIYFCYLDKNIYVHCPTFGKYKELLSDLKSAQETHRGSVYGNSECQTI